MAMTTAATVPVRASNRASKISPVVNPRTLSDQCLTLGTMRNDTNTTLSAEIATSHDADNPSVKPKPPIAILKPPPRSVAAVLAVVCANPISLSAARKDSTSSSFLAARITRRPM